MDIWSWICALPSSNEWTDDSPLVFQLASSAADNKAVILLKAERTSLSSGSSNDEAHDHEPPHYLITFSICIQGFHPSTPSKPLWVSDPCPLSSTDVDKPTIFLPLLMQLVHEIVTYAPNQRHDYTATCPRSQLLRKPNSSEPISWILESHSPESFSKFFNFLFLCRLFWICVCDTPSEVGALYFQSLLTPNLDLLSCKNVIRNFLISVGTDLEQCLMRTLGYILAKWFMLRDLRVGLQLLTTPVPSNGFSYGTEAHGFWVLKGFTPVMSMTRTSFNGQDRSPILHTNETVLKYALAHQQLEVVLQMEYFVTYYDGFIQVNARVDNIRIHVVKLGFNKEGNEYEDERHFPSRIRFWAGPEIGSNYVAGLSLGRSTENQEREVEINKTIKGSSRKGKAEARMLARRKTRSWRWEQDADGNSAIFEATLCDNVSGIEIATWKPESGGGGEIPKKGLRKRYSGGNRLFNKTGGLVVAGDECGGVGWRLSREMEGSVLKWRLGGKIWLSYWPNEMKSSHFETRCVDWCEEVDLPLIRGKFI